MRLYELPEVARLEGTELGLQRTTRLVPRGEELPGSPPAPAHVTVHFVYSNCPRQREQGRWPDASSVRRGRAERALLEKKLIARSL